MSRRVFYEGNLNAINKILTMSTRNAHFFFEWYGAIDYPDLDHATGL